MPVWHEEAGICSLAAHLFESNVGDAFEVIVVDGSPDASTLCVLGLCPPPATATGPSPTRKPCGAVEAAAVPRAIPAREWAPDALEYPSGSSHAVARAIESGRLRGLAAPRGRAVQMNAGAAASAGDILLFLHADTRLPDGAVRLVRDACAVSAAGAFSPRLDSPRAVYRLFSGALRAYTRASARPWGDQAIFVRRDTFWSVGGFAPLPVLEDVDFVRRLRRAGVRLELLRAEVRTSVRRFEASGPWRQLSRNAAIMLAWRLGVAPQRLARWYPNRRDRSPVPRTSDPAVSRVGLARPGEPS